MADAMPPHAQSAASPERSTASGWQRLLVALVATMALSLAPIWPPALGLFAAGARVLIPVEQPLLLLVPAMAVCTVLGWRHGGRLMIALAWVLLAGWMLSRATSGGGASTSYDLLARGWALLLAASFGVVSLLGARRPFFTRALSAVGVAVAIAVLAIAVGSASPMRVARVMERELSRRVESSLGPWRAHTTEPAWQRFAARSPELAARADETAALLERIPAVGAAAGPALLGLESLLMLALAYVGYHRVSRVRIGPVLAPLREFRFNDQLVWGLVVGSTLALLPTLAEWRAGGINLLLFFGALYALRGLGVLTWWAPEWAAVAALVGLLLLVPLLGPAPLLTTLFVLTLGLGLGDTWRDWRNHRARSTT
jgi:hypothetical protein